MERTDILGHRGCVVWLTGLPAAGKSTIAQALEKRLIASHRLAYVLDGDNLREGLCRDLGFSETDRHENIRRVGEVARLFADAGLIVIAACISPYLLDRAAARKASGNIDFIEVYLSTSQSECERRDPKGLYRQARSGEIDNFTGISAPYQAPTSAEIMIDTAECSVDDAVFRIIGYLIFRSVLPPHDPH